MRIPYAVLLDAEGKLAAKGTIEEIPLGEGIRFERRVFHSMFATEDQKEGMAAFVEKRDPRFKHR